MITITKKSDVTGNINSMELPLGADEFSRGCLLRRSGVLIQHAFPTLSAEQREFVKTGITPEEWAEIFADEEEDKD